MGCTMSKQNESQQPMKKDKKDKNKFLIDHGEQLPQALNEEDQEIQSEEQSPVFNKKKQNYNENAISQAFQGQEERYEMYSAIKENNFEKIIQLIKEKNFEPQEELSDGHRWTALHYVCRFNQPIILEYMLKIVWQRNSKSFKDIVNIKTDVGENLLIMASTWKAGECTEVLVKLGGSDPTIVSKNGNAEDVAKYYKNYQAISFLQTISENEVIPVNEEELNNFDEDLYKQKFLEYAKELHQFSIEYYKNSKLNNTYLEGMDQNSETYKKLKQCISANKCYDDPDFPKSVERITEKTDHKCYSLFQSALWLRPHDIFNCHYDDIKLYDNKIEPSDIKQGSLGVCYMLATLCSIAQYEQRVKNLFVNNLANPYGIYGLIFYPNGKRRELVLDDYFPCANNNEDPFFSKPNGCELWVMLLEKAWCKMFKNYTDAEAETPRNFMEEVLGCPTRYFSFDKLGGEQKIFQLIKSLCDQKYNLVLSSKSEKIEGIVSLHAYCLFNAYDYKGIKLIKIMNPWRRYEWNGEYGDKSKKWTEELKQLVDWKDEEDGIFFMTPKELVNCYSSLCAAYFRDEFQLTSIEVQCEPDQDYYFTFTLQQQMEVNFKINQPYKRTLYEENYDYSSCHLELYKINNTTDAQLIADGGEGFAFGNKSILFTDEVFSNLKQGQYLIRVRVSWFDNNSRAINLSSYSQIPLEFQSLNQEEGDQIRYYVLMSEVNKLDAKESGEISYQASWLKYGYALKFTNLNKTDIFSMNLTFPTFVNVKTDRNYPSNENNEIQLHLKPHQEKVLFFEKQDLKGACNISWSFSGNWE